ncbi:MAG: fatty acid desaturase [Cyclobacteriaceae bacterium]
MSTQHINEEIRKTLSNWKDMISKYQIPNNKKAILQLVSTFLPFIGIWIAIYFVVQYSVWLSIPLFALNALFLFRIFVIQHDCGHYSFFKSKRLNNLIGTLCSVFSFIPYSYWSKVHSFHHGHTGQLEVHEIGDVPTITVKEYEERNWFGRFKYRVFRFPLVTFVIAPIYYFLIPCRYPTISFDKLGKYLKITLKDNFWIALTYVVVGTLIGWPLFLLIQFIIIFLFGVAAFWFFYVQHQHEFTYKQWKGNWDYLLSAIRGSSYYKLPKMFQWFTGNIGFHHIHHLSSRIPNYNLPKCFKEQPDLSKYVSVIKFWPSLKMMHYKLWDEEREKMIRFSEYYKLKAIAQRVEA